jgi:hypothetical protein
MKFRVRQTLYSLVIFLLFLGGLTLFINCYLVVVSNRWNYRSISETMEIYSGVF